VDHGKSKFILSCYHWLFLSIKHCILFYACGSDFLFIFFNLDMLRMRMEKTVLLFNL
jgi:hypothetical protein